MKEPAPTLDQILDAYDKIRAAEDQKMKKAISEIEEFEIRFWKLCDEIVKPTFEALGQALKARGHGYNISEYRRTHLLPEKGDNSVLTIEISPQPIKRFDRASSDSPSFSIGSNPAVKEIYFRGPYPPKLLESCKLEEVTADLIEGHFLAVAAEIFKKAVQGD